MEKQCGSQAVFRFTWPGRDESFICLEHAPKLKALADALGCYLQLIPIQPSDIGCRQQVSEVEHV